MFDIHNCYTAVLTTNVIEQRVCDGGATEASTQYIDHGAEGMKLGGGVRPPILKVLVTEIFAGTATVLTITLETDTDSAFGTALKQVMVLAAAIAKAKLTVGKLFQFALPHQVYQRYSRLYFEGDNTFETTGKVKAWIDSDPDPAQAQLDIVA